MAVMIAAARPPRRRRQQLRRAPALRAGNPGQPPVPPPPSAGRFRNPANGYEEDVGMPWLWCLLFGCIYFATRGIWTHALAALLLAIVTFGASWLIYPLFARGIVDQHYLRKGWVPI
jgi:hypothetical protein